MTFLSLFSGIGGFDLGLERAGWKCVGQVEINDYCRRVLAKHWPDVPKWGDIRGVNASELPFADAIIGGDPCQENSNARQGNRTTSPSLCHEYVRLIAERRPRFVLRENPAVVRADAPWPWHRLRRELESLGYAVLPFQLRACCIGADHRRARLFLFAELPNAGGSRLEGNVIEEMARKSNSKRLFYTAEPNRWSAAPRICRGADGIPNRVDRLRGLGNAVVPQVAEWIGRQIITAVEA